MDSVVPLEEREEEPDTAFTLALILVGCLIVVNIVLVLFFVLGADGGIVSDPFSTYPVQPQ